MTDARPKNTDHIGPEGPTRRSVLRAGAGLTLAVATVGTVTACDPPKLTERRDNEEQARSLLPLALSAARQQKQADYLAPRETASTAQLKQVAAERGQHLQALTDEINRLHSPIATEITTSAADSTTTLDRFRKDLQAAAGEAGDFATTSSGFLAGLTGSISASCATLRKVTLA